MRNSYRLKSTLASNYAADLDDVWVIKNDLKKNGYYAEPDYGMNPYPDTAMFEAIKKFQRKHSLKVDGTMYPGGETEQKMDEELPERSPTFWCRICGAPHGGVYSPYICYNCWIKQYK